MDKNIIIDLKTFYSDTAKIENLPEYISKALSLAGEGNIVTLTGQAPIWMYLKIAHALHGKALTLYYDSPSTGKVLIFDHNPY